MKRQAPMLALLALIGGLALTTSASASDYSGNCANVPSSTDGNVSITDGACTLSKNVTATGSISISATSISGGKALSAGSGDVTVTASGGAVALGQLTSSNGNVNVTATGGNLTVGVVNSYLNTKLSGNKVTASTITSSWGVQVTATNGILNLANITSNAANLSGGGNILLSATGTIKAGNLKNNGTSTTGGIEIHANTAGTSTVFNIGGGGTNGTGVLNVSNTTGGGSSPSFMPGGVYVTNGNASSTGGISVSSMSSLLLNSSGGRAGILILDAKSGTLTLPTGTLSADGASGFGAGSIYLLANTLTTANGTIISASQTDAAAATYHYVQIAATTVNVAGASGLQIKADGNGVSQATASAGLVPKNSLAVTSTSDLNSLYWNVVNNAFTTTGTVTVAGSGPIKITSNGNNSRTQLVGNGITFSNSGNAIFEAKGKTSHEILVSYSGTTPPDLTFSGTGNVSFDSSASTDGSGGDINVYARDFVMNKSGITFKADGPTSGNGDGGKIYVSTSFDAGRGFALKSTATATFSANAASSGSGNAVFAELNSNLPRAIAFWAGTKQIQLGSAAGQYTFTANGGSTGGNAGSIAISGSDAQLKSANAVVAKGLAGDGRGGSFESFATLSAIDGTVVNPFVDVRGIGSGLGGRVVAYQFLGAPFNVNAHFKVDGGNGLLTAAENDFGRIEINSTKCQQRTTGQSPWPKTYWNCQHPDSSTTTDKTIYAATDKLHGTTKTALNTANIQIYIMRDVNAFKDFHGVGPANVNGVFGYTYEALKVSAAFFDTLPSTGTPTASALYTGVIIHELAHQLNYHSWAHADSTNSGWLAAYNSANTSFDLGYPGTCGAKVDADRTSTAQAEICVLFNGSAGHPLLKNSEGLNNFGFPEFLSKEERFARAFADAYKRAFPTVIFTDTYYALNANRLTAEQNYMDTVVATGAP